MILWDFIARLEGGQQYVGYVPDAEGSASGVTVATGFDLGQQSIEALRAAELPAELCDKLEPYCGLRRGDAVAALERETLIVTREEADALDRHSHGGTVQAIAARYDAQVEPGAFDSLSDEAQSVIASIAFQYGPDLARRTPLFWDACINADWLVAVAELRNFGDRYPTRRNAEADLLETSAEVRAARSFS